MDISQFINFRNRASDFVDRLTLIDLDVCRGIKNLYESLIGWETIILNIAKEIAISSLNPEKFTSSPAVITDYVVSKLIGMYESNLFFYRFRINPKTLSNTYKKLQSLTQYGHGAYDLEYFGDDFVEQTFTGTTGYCFPPDPLPKIGITDVRLSIPYLSLMHLEKFFKNSSQKLLICFWSEGHLGYIDSLSYSEDSHNPRIINYTIGFKLHPYFVFNLFHTNLTDTYKYGKVFWYKILKKSDVFSNYIGSGEPSIYSSGLTDNLYNPRNPEIPPF
jgi:hypothetical protein